MPGKQKLDQYFTKPEIAQACWERFKEIVKPDMDGYFVEPSAGQGIFSEQMKDVDLWSYELDEELANEYGHIQGDYLALDTFPKNDKPIYVVGNPPFGFQGKLAKQFIEKSFELGAKYVGMILPQSALRVKQYGFHEVDRWKLPAKEAFVDAEGKSLQVLSCWFAIYTFGSNMDDFFVSKPTCKDYVSLHTIYSYKEKNRAKYEPLCDFFLPVSIWASQKSKVKVYDSLELKEMLGVNVKKDHERVRKFFEETDWYELMTHSPHGACHLTHDTIKSKLVEAGFHD